MSWADSLPGLGRRGAVVRALAALALVALASVTPVRAADDETNLAPLWQSQERVGVTRRRALGPFFEYRFDCDGRQFLAVRPFYSSLTDPPERLGTTDILWPIVFMLRSFPTYDQRRSLLGLFYSHNDRPQTNAHQSYLLPLVGWGRTAAGQAYFALFPFGGVMRDFLGNDEVRFWLFPAYFSSRSGPSHSLHVLFPIFARAEGPRARKFRVFPFYGYLEYFGRTRQSFILWPFWHWTRSLDPKAPGGGFFLFPLYGRGHFTASNQKTYTRQATFLWPFFSWRLTETSRSINAPWPLFQWRTGTEDAHSYRHYFWPVYGHRQEEKHDYRFWLWPFFQRERERQNDLEMKSFFFLPFYWDSTDRWDDGREERLVRVWPLASRRLAADGTREWRVLDLWPQRHAEPVERNLAPFWTLYFYRANAQSFRHDLLWGLWQWGRDESGRHHSLFPFYSFTAAPDDAARSYNLLGGLFGRARGPDGTKTRLLWFFRF